MPEPEEHDWESDVCECCEDFATCCYGFWCCPCLACSVSKKFGEGRVLPLCDIMGPAALSACGIPLFVPPAALSLRAGIRNRYRIKGSLCEDIVVSCFCVWCNWCQMHRELKSRRRTPTIINVPPPTIVQQGGPTIVQPSLTPITNHNINHNIKQDFLQIGQQNVQSVAH